MDKKIQSDIASIWSKYFWSRLKHFWSSNGNFRKRALPLLVKW